MFFIPIPEEIYDNDLYKEFIRYLSTTSLDSITAEKIKHEATASTLVEVINTIKAFYANVKFPLLRNEAKLLEDYSRLLNIFNIAISKEFTATQVEVYSNLLSTPETNTHNIVMENNVMLEHSIDKNIVFSLPETYDFNHIIRSLYGSSRHKALLKINFT